MGVGDMLRHLTEAHRYRHSFGLRRRLILREAVAEQLHSNYDYRFDRFLIDKGILIALFIDRQASRCNQYQMALKRRLTAAEGGRPVLEKASFPTLPELV